MQTVAKSLTSTIDLNDGVTMPLFGLGMFRSSSGEGGMAEKCVMHALTKGYKLLDTAEYYGNEADVGRGIRNSGVRREDIFVITKLWENGYDRCKEIFNDSLKKMDIGYVDLYLIHSPLTGKNAETFKAMQELKQQGLISDELNTYKITEFMKVKSEIETFLALKKEVEVTGGYVCGRRSIGVSNFGVQHIEGLKNAGLPLPSVNQIELHPWQQRKDLVRYCREQGITVMGYSPLTKGKKLSDPTLKKIAESYNKSTAQILIRWSVEHGYVTIPKSSDTRRIEENADVFDWCLRPEDVATLNTMPEWTCIDWAPCDSPWNG